MFYTIVEDREREIFIPLIGEQIELIDMGVSPLYSDADVQKRMSAEEFARFSAGEIVVLKKAVYNADA